MSLYKFLFVDIPAIFKKKNYLSTLDNDIVYVEEHGKLIDQIYRVNNTTKLIRARHDMGVFIFKWDNIFGKEKLWLEEKIDIKELYNRKDKEIGLECRITFFSNN